MNKVIQIIIIIIFIYLLFHILNIILDKKYVTNYFMYTINKKNGILLCHQGWADIFNTLSIINYYYNKNIYNKIYIIIRNNGKEIVEFFTRDKSNIIIIEFDSAMFCENSVCNDVNIAKYYIENNKDICDNSDYLFHGFSDIFRQDKYKNGFDNAMKIDKDAFVNSFYESYDLDKNIRIDNFIFTRDIELENSKYNEFIEKNGSEYIVYHTFYENKNNLSIPFINLDKSTNVFFDYIKILENSKEIHVIDSSWAVFIYLLDAKYKLFYNKNIPIYLYLKRNYAIMFQDPVKLDNWIFIENN